MPLKSIKQILIERDHLTEAQAEDQLKEAHEQFVRYLESGDLDLAEDICNEYFGLEPDYLYEFL
jgi:DNA-binding GntR family transcriptional regulator